MLSKISFHVHFKYHYVKNKNYFSVVVGLVKGSTTKKPHLEIWLPSFPEDPALCSFSSCQEYIRTTQTHRPDSSGKDIFPILH